MEKQEKILQKKGIKVFIKSWIVQLNEGTHCYRSLTHHQIQ